MFKSVLCSVFPSLRNKATADCADYSKEARKRQEEKLPPKKGTVKFDKGSGLEPRLYGLHVAIKSSYKANRKSQVRKAFG